MGATRLLGAAGIGVLVSALLVHVYIAIVARALPPEEYAVFGAFWAVVMVLGFGAFLPLEQELARRLPHPQDRRRLLRSSAGAAAALAVFSLVALAAATPIVFPSLDGNRSALLALAALCCVSGAQFFLRGTLIGTDRLVRHAGIMVLDAVARLGVAIAIFVLGGASAAAFCWALVGAIAVSHIPQIPAAVRRAIAGSPRSAQRPVPAPSTAEVSRAAAPLLVGSVCSQLLVNGLPVLVVAQAAGRGQEAAAGIFVAAFTLAKAPLSMVVPLQSAVVPTLSRLIAAGRRREVLLLLAAGAGLLTLIAAVGAPLAMWLGPAVVTLVFGSEYLIGGLELAVIVCGVLANIALVIVTQVHVARGRHRDVALSWTAGLVAAGVTFALVPGLTFAGAVAFLVGSVVGAAASTLILAASRRRPVLEDRT